MTSLSGGGEMQMVGYAENILDFKPKPSEKGLKTEERDS
jgi:hypothetical protein